MASLLVIGGSGFFGKSILHSFSRGLLKKWKIEEIIILSRSATQLKKNFPELLSPEVKFLDLDISICTELPYADFVIHAAASTEANKYLITGSNEHDNIILATKNFCRLSKVFFPNSKIIYVSSGAVYGVQPVDILEIPESFNFNSSVNLMSASKIKYAIAKRESEKMIIELSRNGAKTSIARCFAFVGKYLPLDQHFAIGNFIKDGIAGDPLKVHAKNIVYRSYMYADDLVEWLLTILYFASTNCPIFNVGSNEAIRIDYLAKIIAEKCSTTVSYLNQIEDFVDIYVPSIRLANQHGMKVKYNLDQSIEQTLQFHSFA